MADHAADLAADLIAELQTMDTPTVCNALELLVPRRRGYGFTTQPLVCTRPELKPIVALARTATIRAAHPGDLTPEAGRALSDAYYAYIDAGPKPSVVVIQDLDAQRGYGAYWGEVNSSIHMGFGCVAVITDGGVRDLPEIAPGFQMLAGRVIPSHAFVHVVDFGRPVDVAGMRVRDGDLIHADQHGAVVIPHEVAAAVRGSADQVIRRERVIIDAARQPGFDFAKLKAAQGRAAEIH
jgi:regulator of RNase E activity RraA